MPPHVQPNPIQRCAHDVEHCTPTDFGAASGSCTTTWDYKVNFRLVKKHKHR